MVDLIPRSAWGARYRDGFGARALPTAECWLHHTVTLAPDLDFRDLNADSRDDDEVAAMRNIESIGQKRFGAGFSYNAALMPSGRLYEGCGVARVGSHTAGRNTRAFGLVIVGNYETAELPAPMRAALPAFLRDAAAAGWIDQPRFDGGHRDLKQTSCPGINAYRLIPTFNAEAGAPAPPPPVTPPHVPPPAPIGDEMDAVVARWGLLKLHSTGQGVRIWQGLLYAFGHLAAADVIGTFGPKTDAATRSWQAAANVPGGADGVVGANTWGRALGTR